MMLHATPRLTPALREQLDRFEALRTTLHDQRPPERWLARLRRSTRGTVASSSVAIEGFRVPAERAASILAGEQAPSSPDDEVVAAYGRAMDHVVALSDDPGFRWDWRVIADLHFDLAWPDPSVRPGRVRRGPMYITGADGTAVYEAPSDEELEPLLRALVDWLQRESAGLPAPVAAAMAHLHLVSIHPFADGNGRISRVLQSLVLGRAGYLAPEVASIEEYLAEHTQAYYDALQAAHGERYDPSRSALGWIEFCLGAHVTLAERRAVQLESAARRWATLEALVDGRGWPDRLVIALELALTTGLDRSTYAREGEIADVTASLDLRRLVDAGLLVSAGSSRSTRYGPTPALAATVDARA